MSASNRTSTARLPQFADTDKPTWLGDFNDAMLRIDQTFSSLQSDIVALQNRCAAAEARITVLEGK